MSQRNYIQQLLDRTGWTRTELAKRAGLDPSTLSRFLTNADETHELRATTIKRLELVSGIPFSDDNPLKSAQTGMAEAEALPFNAESHLDVARAIAALSSDTKNLDAWTLQNRSLELAGYRSGDVLLVQLDAIPLRGDVVCVQVYDWANSRAQTLFRLFQPPFLAVATTDIDLHQPISLEDSRVAVKGVVVMTIRARPFG